MRVVCSTFSEFKAALEAALNHGDSLFENAVRISRYSNKLSEASEEVTVHFSAVVLKKDDGGQYLLAAGVNCGMNYFAGRKEMFADEKIEKFTARLKEMTPPFVLLPGRIEA